MKVVDMSKTRTQKETLRMKKRQALSADIPARIEKDPEDMTHDEFKADLKRQRALNKREVYASRGLMLMMSDREVIRFEVNGEVFHILNCKEGGNRRIRIVGDRDNVSVTRLEIDEYVEGKG